MGKEANGRMKRLCLYCLRAVSIATREEYYMDSAKGGSLPFA